MEAVKVSARGDFDGAFAEMSRQAPGGVFVQRASSLSGLVDPIIARALSLRIPTIGTYGSVFARAGALFAYSYDPREAIRGVARLLKKILDGANPAELPFEQPTKFNFAINLKTATTLVLEIPPMRLSPADRVIE